MPKKSPAFDLKLSTEQLAQLADDLCTEITDALTARSLMIGDGGLIDLADWYYEQGRSDPKDLPFQGAADLTSTIFTETIDTLCAKLMDSVFGVEPFCIVDGWGADAAKAPTVEAFHEWQVQEEGLEEELGKVVLGGLIEDCFVLEVRERVETRRLTETINVALETTPEGGAIFEPDEKGTPRPKLRFDADGEPVIAQDGEQSAQAERTYTKTKRLGPEYDAISMKDFVFLPGHAKNQRQVYGYAYRFWPRLPEIQEKADDGIYDEAMVKQLGEQSDRDDSTSPNPSADVASQTNPASVEKELWQLAIKRDFDEDGREEWYLGTLSLRNRVLLRLKLDKFVMKVGRPRCVPFVLFPRRNSVYGYAFGLDKMLTLAEEDTALRNMIADRSNLATNAPMTVLQSAALDIDAQPFGIGAKIAVRDHNDIKQLQITDVPQSAIYQRQVIMELKERVGGLSDVGAVGSGNRHSDTLGQDRMVAMASSVRVKQPLGYFRRAIAEVMKLRHAIWVETLEADPKGMEAPSEVVDRLSTANIELKDGRFTADQLKGKFRFKPYGSVDTADAGTRMQYFDRGFATLGKAAQMFPLIQQIFMNPEVTVRVLQEWARVYKVRDVNVFLKALQPAQPMLPPASGMSAGDPMQSGQETGAPDAGPDLNTLMAALGGAPAGEGDGGFSSY